jgi:hypothetical protein
VTINGKIQHVTAWCKEMGMSPNLVYNRLHHGWSEIEALTTPVMTPAAAGAIRLKRKVAQV